MIKWLQKAYQDLLSSASGRWWEKLGAFAVICALLFVINPELRAVLLLADALGVEVMVLLFWAQLRSFVPVMFAWLRDARDRTRRWFSRI